MKTALFLHAYQPPTQFPEITNRIVQESYWPIVQTLIENPQARLTLNLAGSLTEQLVTLGHQDLLNRVGYLVVQGQIELVGTAAFHPLLTMLPVDEIIRQDEINRLINSKALGVDSFQPRGFFLPEMVYERRVAKVLAQQGYEWILLDESAFPKAAARDEGEKNHLQLEIAQSIYHLAGLPMAVFFRDRPISLSIAFAKDQRITAFDRDMYEHFVDGQERYVVLAVDAETFGHHNHDRVELLRRILTSPHVESVRVSDLLEMGFNQEQVEPVRSTWGITLEDSNQKRTFPRWDNPDNPVHQLQWELFNLAISSAGHQSDQLDVLDRAIHSDQFWWASHNPCWLPKMVERGARMLQDAILQSPNTSVSQKDHARKLYQNIIVTAQEEFGDAPINC